MNRWILGIPVVLALAPSASAADFFATGDNGTSLVRINAATGATTTIGSLGHSGSFAAAFTSDGRLFTLTNSGAELAQVDVSSGAATIIGTTGSIANAMALAGDSTGNLYSVDWNGNVYRANTATGAFLLLFATPATMSMDLAFDGAGALWSAGNSQLWRINLASASAQQVSTLSVNAMGLVIDSNGNFLVTDWSAAPALYGLDPQSGLATPIGNVGSPYVHGGDFQPVPEPTSIVLIASGLAALASRRRRSAG